MRRLAVIAAGLGLATALAAPAGAGAKLAFRGTALVPPLKAPSFALRDQSRHVVSLLPSNGRITVVAFLYTHCPDVCPLIADQLNGALRTLGSERSKLRVLAISVDPAHDTPSAVARFVRVHRLLPEFHYLTGTRKQLAPIWSGFHIAAAAGPNGVVSHSAFELLVDPQGRERVIYDSKVRSTDVVHDVKLLLETH
jgi:protein SCO1/2